MYYIQKVDQRAPVIFITVAAMYPRMVESPSPIMLITEGLILLMVEVKIQTYLARRHKLTLFFFLS